MVNTLWSYEVSFTYSVYQNIFTKSTFLWWHGGVGGYCQVLVVFSGCLHSDVININVILRVTWDTVPSVESQILTPNIAVIGYCIWAPIRVCMCVCVCVRLLCACVCMVIHMRHPSPQAPCHQDSSWTIQKKSNDIYHFKMPHDSRVFISKGYALDRQTHKFLQFFLVT